MSDREASHYPHCRIRREIDGRDCPECAGLDAAIRGARERDDARREVERLQAERDEWESIAKGTLELNGRLLQDRARLVAALRVFATRYTKDLGIDDVNDCDCLTCKTWWSPEVQAVLPLFAEPAKPEGGT